LEGTDKDSIGRLRLTNDPRTDGVESANIHKGRGRLVRVYGSAKRRWAEKQDRGRRRSRVPLITVKEMSKDFVISHEQGEEQR
jgi:hypothetical protein